MQVFIVAGHGGIDKGAIAPDGTTERELNVAIARKLSGIQIGVEDELSLSEKIAQINAIATANSLLLSIHCNSAVSDANGVETWCNSQSQDLARILVDNLSIDLGLQNRGTKDESENRYGSLGIIARTRPLAVLIELGFLSNKQDLRILKSRQKQIATSIEKSIQKYRNSLVLSDLSDIWLEAEQMKDWQSSNPKANKIQSLAHNCADNIRQQNEY